MDQLYIIEVSLLYLMNGDFNTEMDNKTYDKHNFPLLIEPIQNYQCFMSPASLFKRSRNEVWADFSSF